MEKNKIDKINEKNIKLSVRKGGKYFLLGVNLGEVGHPARILYRKWKEINPNENFSRLVRKWIIVHFSQKPEYKGFKLMQLQYEKKILVDNINKISEELKNINEKIDQYQ